MKVIDFYQGFEGEPEVVVSHRGIDGGLKSQINMWFGYFDDLMEHIPPGKSGDWEGVPKYYHSLIHWRDNKDWECTNIQLFIDQLTAIDPSKLRLESTLVLETLVHFAKTCVESKERLFILQD
jgi:hypothetical protein